eukprot:scaffold31625_cov65-Cyclotella_meneghiniana.AAC.8
MTDDCKCNCTCGGMIESPNSLWYRRVPLCTTLCTALYRSTVQLYRCVPLCMVPLNELVGGPFPPVTLSQQRRRVVFNKPQRALSSSPTSLSLASAVGQPATQNPKPRYRYDRWTRTHRPIMMMTTTSSTGAGLSRCSFASDYLNSSGKQFANAIQHLKFPPAFHPSPGRSTIDD